MTIDAANPTIARWNVIPTARRTSPLSVMSHNEPATARGPGSAYSGFQPLHTTHCQANRKIATAASFGHVASNTARAVSRRGRRPVEGAAMSVDGASATATADTARSSAASMDQCLGTQGLGDLDGEGGDRPVIRSVAGEGCRRRTST